MALSHTDQFFEALGRARHVLIALPAHPGTDQLAAAAALLAVCGKMGKPADAVAAGFTGRAPDFLPAARIKGVLPPLNTLVIRLPVDKVPLHDLSYRLADGHLEIAIAPKSGGWRPEEVRAEPAAAKYDFVVTLGAQDLDALGALHGAHPELFLSVPTANVDNDPANEHFGTMNYVDLTAASVTEVLYRLLRDRDRSLVDEETATALLAGIIAKSRSFTAEKMAPETLAAAAELVALGADRERIVHGLYRTRSVQTLRLWGRALSRLKADPARKLVWTALARSDFAAAGGSEQELGDVLEELIAASPEAQVAVLLYEAADGTVCGIIDAKRPHHAAQLAKGFAPEGGGRRARVRMRGKDVAAAERELVTALTAALPLS